MSDVKFPRHIPLKCVMCGYCFLGGCPRCYRCRHCIATPINPATKRPIKTDGPTFKRLIRDKVIIDCQHHQERKGEVKMEGRVEESFIPTQVNRPSIDLLDNNLLPPLTDLVVGYVNLNRGYRSTLKDCSHSCTMWSFCCRCTASKDPCPQCK